VGDLRLQRGSGHPGLEDGSVNPWVFLAIDLGTAYPYSKSWPRLIRSLAGHRLQTASFWALVLVGSFLAPYLYVAIAGDDVAVWVWWMLGFSPVEVLSRNVFELLSITEAERLRSAPMPNLSGSTVEVQIRGTDGQVHAVEVAITDMRQQPEVDGIVLNIRDVTERKTLEDDLRHQALNDDLTGLPNRALFSERVKSAVRASGTNGELVAVLFVDLDDFKLINDSLSHVVGDQVLVGIADRVQQALRLSDMAARLGGDEFAVLLSGV